MGKTSIEKCATADIIHRWEDIDFRKAEKYVKKLQKRLAAAYCKNELDKVEFLQHTMVHSFYPKALAVKFVTSNRGKNTPGVDGELWELPRDKYDAMSLLCRRGYKPLPLKRVYIPKGDGRFRPLSIPTMKDRAMQTLYRFTLEPIGWMTADVGSFAYLPNRSAKGAIIHIGELLSNTDFRWVMKADIKACFDNISHEWIMEHIPMDKVILRKFLKCGYVDGLTCYPTERGVPQGGCISSTICNMTLDGLEKLLEQRFGQSVRLIRYADDIAIVAKSRLNLVQAVTPVMEEFLFERGLSISKEKTGYYPVQEEFSFLGYNLSKRGNDFIAVPSRKRIDSLLNKVTVICDPHQQLSDGMRCEQLKQRIRGWMNYYVGVVPIQSLLGVEFEVEMLINHLTDDMRLAEAVWKIFSRY